MIHAIGAAHAQSYSPFHPPYSYEAHGFLSSFYVFYLRYQSISRSSRQPLPLMAYGST